MSSLSAIVFVTAIGVLLIKEITSAYHSSVIANENTQLVSLLSALESIAHNHAVERGLSAGFLASGSSEQKSKVDAQRVKADQSEAVLKELLTKEWPESYLIEDKTAPIIGILARKSEIRREVDVRNGANAFGYYSALNSSALEALQILGISIEDPVLISQVNSAFLFASVKEKTGQVRGKVNGILSSQSATAEAKKEITAWMVERAKYMAFVKASNPDKIDELNTVFNSPNFIKFADTVELLNSDNPDYSSLPDSATWFAFATQVIGSVKKELEAQWESVRLSSTNSEASAYRYITILVVATVVLGAFLVLLNISLVKMLKGQLGTLTMSLDRISDEGDLTIDVALDSNNELGSISRAVNKTIGALRALVVGLDKSISVSSKLGERLDTATLEVLQEATEAKEKASDIDEATRQIADASRQIAESSADTLTFSRELETYATQAVEQSRSAQNNVNALNTSMVSMGDDAAAMGSSLEKISSFLNTINSLAEQTNLLALNAAIEAARAGEQGRGFAVVADEVRSLAGSSKQASDQISTLLEELHQISQSVMTSIDNNTAQSKVVLEASGSAAKSSEEVGQKIKDVENLSTTVATAAEEQSVSLADVSQKVSEVLNTASNQTELAHQLRVIFEDVKLNNKILQNTMDGFKL
nr:methyl-accepting chemotaxis protein [Alteromonas sp. 5E99-2]